MLAHYCDVYSPKNPTQICALVVINAGTINVDDCGVCCPGNMFMKLKRKRICL